MPEFNEIIDKSSLWGKLYVPCEKKNVVKPGLRTVFLGSTSAGDLVLNNLIRFEEKFPDKLNIIAVATDDPLDENAKISVNKRIWSYYSAEEKEKLFRQFLNTSMESGISCYSGAVKIPYFRDLLSNWAPEVIIICCFGQKVDHFIYNYPLYGAYNFHPSDLRRKIGAGAKPFLETIKNENLFSHMSIHIVTEEIDAGPVVGLSPPINICLGNGKYPSSILTFQEKIPSVCGWMCIELLLEIIDQKEKGIISPVRHLDYDLKIPFFIKQKLLEPAIDDPSADYSLPPHYLLS